MWAAPEAGEFEIWNSRHRVVEEVDSDIDSRGVGLVPGNRRLMGDPLHSTGMDMRSGGRSRRGYGHQQSDESTEEEATENSDEDTEDETQVALRESEEALVQSALARIRKARSKGKQDVRLNREELAALERRRKRLQAEAAKKKGASSNGEKKRRKQKEQRYAVPLAQLNASPSSASDDALPRHPSPTTLRESQERARPPKGLFPPPSASRNRSTGSTQRSPSGGHGSSSPFDYKYVEAPPNHRHASDPSARPRSYHASQGPDPFQFLTATNRPPYPHGTVASRSSQGAVAAELTSSGEATSSDDRSSNGVHMPRTRSRDEAVMVEASPEPEPERPKSKRTLPSSSSTTKRKPVSSNGTSSRRRKAGK